MGEQKKRRQEGKKKKKKNLSFPLFLSRVELLIPLLLLVPATCAVLAEGSTTQARRFFFHLRRSSGKKKEVREAKQETAPEEGDGKRSWKYEVLFAPGKKQKQAFCRLFLLTPPKPDPTSSHFYIRLPDRILSRLFCRHFFTSSLLMQTASRRHCRGSFR